MEKFKTFGILLMVLLVLAACQQTHTLPKAVEENTTIETLFNGDTMADLLVGVPIESLNDIHGNSVSTIGKVTAYTFSQTSSGSPFVTGQDISQNDPAIPAAGEKGDYFGDALAVGDFNGDGEMDAVIGVPAEDVQGNINSGTVHIIYNANGQLDPSQNQMFFQGENGVAGLKEAGDSFGHALAVGRFNNDQYDDLAISTPYEGIDINSDGTEEESIGIVQIFSGSASGLIYQQDISFPGTPESGDEFGSALAAGDFDNNGQDDLVIGVPTLRVNNKSYAGAVVLVYGELSGLNPSSSQILHRDIPGVLGNSDDKDFFGTVLATGDINNDGYADLAVQVERQTDATNEQIGAVQVFYGSQHGIDDINPNNDLLMPIDVGYDPWLMSGFGSALSIGDFDSDGFGDLAIGVPAHLYLPDEAGAMYVVYGLSTGLDRTRTQMWSQDDPDVRGVAEAYDRFGYALASGDFNDDGADDIAIGAPGESYDNIGDHVGGVHILFGVPTHGLTANGSGDLNRNDMLIHDYENGLLEAYDWFGEVLAVSR